MVRSKTTKAKAGARRSSGSARGGATRQATRSSARSGGRSSTRSSSARSKVSASGASRGGRAAPGISRIDQEATRTHGYFVRLGYERTSAGTWRPRHRAFFGDASYGGKTKALRAAKDWLAEVTGED